MNKDETIKAVEDQLKIIQERYRRSTGYDVKIKADSIYDLFEVRKANANRMTSVTEKNTLLDNIHAKHEKYMTNVNNIDGGLRESNPSTQRKNHSTRPNPLLYYNLFFYT